MSCLGEMLIGYEGRLFNIGAQKKVNPRSGLSQLMKEGEKNKYLWATAQHITEPFLRKGRSCVEEGIDVFEKRPRTGIEI